MKKIRIVLLSLCFAFCLCASVMVFGACGESSLTSIKITNNPKTVYEVGKYFDATGGEITCTYSNGTTAKLPLSEATLTMKKGDKQVALSEFDTVGTVEILAKYGDRSCSLTVIVNPTTWGVDVVQEVVKVYSGEAQAVNILENIQKPQGAVVQILYKKAGDPDTAYTGTAPTDAGNYIIQTKVTMTQGTPSAIYKDKTFITPYTITKADINSFCNYFEYVKPETIQYGDTSCDLTKLWRQAKGSADLGELPLKLSTPQSVKDEIFGNDEKGIYPSLLFEYFDTDRQVWIPLIANDKGEILLYGDENSPNLSAGTWSLRYAISPLSQNLTIDTYEFQIAIVQKKLTLGVDYTLTFESGTESQEITTLPIVLKYTGEAYTAIFTPSAEMEKLGFSFGTVEYYISGQSAEPKEKNNNYNLVVKWTFDPTNPNAKNFDLSNIDLPFKIK